MDDLTTPPPPRVRRVRARARTLPSVPTSVWVILGLIVVVWGFWSLRPQRTGTDIERVVESQAAGGASSGPTGTVETTPAPRPALEPIEPVQNASLPAPAGDTGFVGTPGLTPVAGAGGAQVQEQYTVASGDTLSSIASRFGITLDELMSANGLTDPNYLYVGQLLLLPSTVELAAPFQKLIPDSELILSPAYVDFELEEVIDSHEGFLSSYSEEVEGAELPGPEIVERVSSRYSVGPRVLLALLEYKSGWVTERSPAERAYPMGSRDPRRSGLFQQLSWAANRLNEGYYGKVNGRDNELVFKDGTRALFHPDTNPGTAALQNFFAVEGTPDDWSNALAEDGFFESYVDLFGDPWKLPATVVVAEDITQPQLSLPWADDETWYFTGGPHGGWGDFSGWAALDFVPADNTGCAASSFWVTAAAAGTVIRSETGEVVVDLDGDGFVGTGWTIFYMHMATAGRVGLGTKVEVGDPIGRPSCEGGFSDAAHLHIARRYNGQWIDADGPIPFVLDGWEAESSPRSYDGFLVRGTERLEACACRGEGINALSARP